MDRAEIRRLARRLERDAAKRIRRVLSRSRQRRRPRFQVVGSPGPLAGRPVARSVSAALWPPRRENDEHPLALLYEAEGVTLDASLDGFVRYLRRERRVRRSVRWGVVCSVSCKLETGIRVVREWTGFVAQIGQGRWHGDIVSRNNSICVNHSRHFLFFQVRNIHFLHILVPKYRFFHFLPYSSQKLLTA